MAPHRVLEGDRPTNVLLAEVLTPYREAGRPSQGTIRGIDSFDQRGVELGEVLAVAISSTNALIRHYPHAQGLGGTTWRQTSPCSWG